MRNPDSYWRHLGGVANRTSAFLRICLALVIWFAWISWTNVAAQSSGGYGGEFLRHGVGGRATGMGGAFTGVADDASALFYNPAGLVQLPLGAIGYFNASLFMDTRYEYAASLYPLYNLLRTGDKLVLGVGYVGLRMGGFEKREAGTHRKLGTFRDDQIAYLFPLAYDYLKPWGRLAFGTQLMLLQHSIADYQDNATGMDFSLLFQPLCLGQLLGIVNLPYVGRWFDLESMMRWRFGLVLKTLGSLQLKEHREDLPSSLHLGVSRIFPRLFGLPGRLLGALEAGKIIGSPEPWRTVLGGEYSQFISSGFFGHLRVGYRPGASGKGRRLGWGLGLEVGGAMLSKVPGLQSAQIDFAQDRHSILSAVNSLFFTLQFGRNREDVWDLRSISENQWKRLPEEDLLRLLSWHAREGRCLRGDTTAIQIDAMYRDGEEANSVTGVAEELMSRFPRGSSWYDCLEDFVGRICLPVPHLCLGTCEGRPKFDQRLASEFRTAKQWSRQQLPEIRRKIAKICRPKNRECVGGLAQIAVLGDDIALARKLLNCVSPDSMSFYEALVEADTASLARAAKWTANAYGRVYFEFVLGVRSRDVSILQKVRDDSAAWRWACCAFPRTSPYVPDGTVGDDAELVSICLSTGQDESQRWAEVIELYQRYPTLSAGRVIARALRDANGSLSTFVADVLDWYGRHTAPGQMLWDEELWPRRPAS